jgi:ferredoxin
MPKVFFVKEKKEVEVPQGANLRQEAIKNGIDVYKGLSRYLNCLGHGSCGTCRVIIKEGKDNLSPQGLLEKFTLWRMLASIGHEEEMRLSCQVKVNGDCKVETQPGFNWEGENFWQKPYPNK